MTMTFLSTIGHSQALRSKEKLFSKLLEKNPLQVFHFSKFTFPEKKLRNWDVGYCKSAQDLVVPSLIQLQDSLKVLNSSSLPHEVKSLRKFVGQVRSYLDLFSFCFPRYSNIDPLLETRNLLDQGYETIGGFKDLFDMLLTNVEDLEEGDLDAELVNKRRLKSLIWKTRYINFMNKEKNLLYFSNSLKNQIEVRPVKKQSKYYWRISSENPCPQAPTRFVFLSLASVLFNNILNLYPETWDIEDILLHSEQIKFHHFRKSLRSTLKLASYFKGLIPEEIVMSEDWQSLKSLVSLYGGLNDQFLGLHYLQSGDAPSELSPSNKLGSIEDKQTKILQMWSDIQVWQFENNIPTRVEKVMSDISQHL